MCSLELCIHPVGSVTPFNLSELRRRVYDTLREVKPDVIRGHGPFLQGYFAVCAAQKLQIPSYISIHDDISIYRRFWTYGKGYCKITAYQIALKLLGWEKYTYRNADRIVPKYEAAARLVRKSGYGGKVRVIYNQIFLEKFVDLKPRMTTGERLKIINVGRQFAGKDQRPLIEALAEIEAELTLVGTGPMRGQLERVAARSGVADRVTFIDSVPNHELPRAFVGHHVFAINISQPGVCMPVMEAMALGLPVVINRPRWDAEPEVCGGCAWIVDGSSDSYRAAFQKLIGEPSLVEQLGARCRLRIEEFSGEKMEERERDLILELMHSSKT